jgi:hypothetical protein
VLEEHGTKVAGTTGVDDKEGVASRTSGDFGTYFGTHFFN